MEQPQISKDDITDVIEMTEKLEKFIYKVFEGNDLNLCFSALSGAFINSLLSQMISTDEAILYRNIFFKIMDRAIADFNEVFENDED